jgi:UDP-glucose:(heptosyl)LPS alpha-1,3-glucosyltransferase
MHLALVRREMTLHRSGAERMCVTLLKHAVNAGHRVTVVAEKFDPELRAGAEFLPVPARRWSGWSKTQAFAEAASRILSRHSFDVVHGLARVPGVDTFHALDPIQAHWLTVQYPQAWQARLQHWNPRHRSILDLERKLYGPNGPRRIIVQSQFDRELLQSYYGVADERLTVIPNGVDLREFSLKLRGQRPQFRRELHLAEQTPMILFAGMDFRRKGLETLIRAIPRLNDSSAMILVAGKGPIEKYSAVAKEVGVADRIRFLGQVSQMANLYVAADVMALPTRYDPFASVVLESLACGTPVVTSRCGGGATAIDEPLTGSVIHDPLDAAELTGALNQQLTLIGDRTQACAARAGRFTAEAYASQTLAVSETAARRRAA